MSSVMPQGVEKDGSALSIPRYQTETPVATVMRYLRSCFSPRQTTDEDTLLHRDINADPLNEIREIQKKQRQEANDVGDKTIFYRLSSDQLGLEGTHPTDVVIGVVDGKLVYELSQDTLRPVAKGRSVQAAFAGTLLAASAGSYLLTGEGVLTKALATALFSTITPQIGKIPYVPQFVTPVVAAAGTFGATKIFGSNVYVQFSFLLGIGLCAILYKRGGKALATGGWGNFKKYVIPVGVTETQVKSLFSQASRTDPHYSYSQHHQVVKRVEINPYEKAALSAPHKLSLEFSIFDQDMYYSLVVEGKEKEVKLPPVKMSSKDDDDDDDDDEKVKQKTEVEGSKKEKPAKVKKKKEKTTAFARNLKTTALIAGSFLLTAMSKYFTGEGLTTTAFNSVFSASLKAQCRTMAFLNGYGLLTLASGAAVSINLLYPESFIGSLYFMPLSALVGMAVKDYKDRIVTGKPPKNPDIYSIPLAMQRLALQMGWKPISPTEQILPLSSVLSKKNKDKLKIDFDASKISPSNPECMIPAELKMSARALAGSYKLDKKKQAELHLGRLKGKKPGRAAEIAFITASVALTLLSSFLTKQSTPINTTSPTIQAQNMGEGVVTSILNSVLATYMKQVGRRVPIVPRDGGLLAVSIGAVALERYLISIESLPMLFSSIATTSFIAIQSKKAKQWVFSKPYSKVEGWITPSHPTSKEIEGAWEAAKTKATQCLNCDLSGLRALLATTGDDSTMLLRHGIGINNQFEVLVLGQV
jgi:hypothetical protein